MWANAMKTTLFVLFLALCTTTALGQSVLPSQPQIFEIPDHPLHAAPHDLATEQSLLGGSCYTYAQGEMPLWEAGSISRPTPLGDSARALRKQKEAAPVKKAEVVWQN
jgi:hypothetical protein